MMHPGMPGAGAEQIGVQGLGAKQMEAQGLGAAATFAQGLEPKGISSTAPRSLSDMSQSPDVSGRGLPWV